MTVSLGLAGALGPDLIGHLAPDIEAAGFDTLWVNDTPSGDALAALAAAARVTSRLRLATGVVPIDRRPAADILAAVRSSGIPEDRLTVGIGSGSLRAGALHAVRDATDVLRGALSAQVVVGALGPRMRRLGAEHADGVLLNWVTAADAARQAEALHARAAGSRVCAYVRTAVDEAARPRLVAESQRYAAIPTYAANLARLGVDIGATVFDGEDALRAGLPAYVAAVDEVVLRAITADDGIEAYRAFLARTGPAV